MSGYRVPLFGQNQFDRVKNCQVIVKYRDNVHSIQLQLKVKNI